MRSLFHDGPRDLPCLLRDHSSSGWACTIGPVRKRRDIWWLRYYCNGKRPEESARTTKGEEARDLLKQLEGGIASGRAVSPKAGRLRFENAAKELMTEYTVNGRRTLAHLQGRLDLHLTPVFGLHRLVDIRRRDFRQASTAEHRGEVLKAFSRSASADRLSEQSACHSNLPT